VAVESLRALGVRCDRRDPFACCRLRTSLRNIIRSPTATFAFCSRAWTGTLTITNWHGVAFQSSDVAEIIFGTGGLTSTQLGQVYWANQNISGSTLLGTSELVPIPEPRIYAAVVCLLCAVGWRERKRILGLFQRSA